MVLQSFIEVWADCYSNQIPNLEVEIINLTEKKFARLGSRHYDDHSKLQESL